MKKVIGVLILLLLFAGIAAAEAGEWDVLQPGWWNAPRDAVAAVRDQLANHIRMMTGQAVVPSSTQSTTQQGDWSILQPGWWNAPLDQIQATEQQLSNHIDVLDGRLKVVGVVSEPNTSYMNQGQNTVNTAGAPMIDPQNNAGMQYYANSAYATTGQVSQAVPYNNGTQTTANTTAAGQASLAAPYYNGTQTIANTTAAGQTPLIVPANQVAGVQQTAYSAAGAVYPGRVAAGTATSVKIVSTKEVNIRAYPDTYSTIYGRAKPGEVYPFLGTGSNGWYKIQLPDGRTTGYVSNKLATLTNEAPNVPTVATYAASSSTSSLSSTSSSSSSSSSKSSSSSSSTSTSYTDPYLTSDKSEYIPADFDYAFNNTNYIARNVMINGVVANVTAASDNKTIIFTINHSAYQTWEVSYIMNETDQIHLGDTVTVLGQIKANTTIDSSTKVEIINILAKYVEVE